MWEILLYVHNNSDIKKKCDGIKQMKSIASFLVMLFMFGYGEGGWLGKIDTSVV